MRALIAYSGVAGVVGVALLISISRGAGWRPAMAGMPLYVILIIGVTYQFIKEILILNKSERKNNNFSSEDL
ncbi:hypothetical protein [Paraburkholderia bannensis]|uniref:hypothetical protein n=1 Tax=Paraburkholderia bannensis TaxID=765414 RepID=UPI002AB7E096|nr:hypothetical protein [Paraburkholderia bannensis]